MPTLCPNDANFLPMVDGEVQVATAASTQKQFTTLDPMGLDAVEIVLRVEDLFGIEISDDEAASVRTVGAFYELICAKLNLVPLALPVTSKELPTVTQREKLFLFLVRHTPLPAPPQVLPWSAQSAWDCLVTLLVDQQGLKPEQIKYNATLVDDLGID